MESIITEIEEIGPLLFGAAAIVLALKQVLPVIIATPRKLSLMLKNIKAMTLKDIYNDLSNHEVGIHDLTERVEEIESLPSIRQALGDGS